jgi:hypothetical protein
MQKGANLRFQVRLFRENTRGVCCDLSKNEWSIQADNPTLADHPAVSYLLGDLDGDFDNDIYDFDLFRIAYERTNPALGAFAAMVASAAVVPEPATGIVLLIGMLALHFRREKG